MLRSVAMINDWFEIQLQENTTVWCEDPETSTEKVAANLIEKSYLTYRIKSIKNGQEISGLRSRYSTFESVRISLRNRYHPLGILVPPLPAKYTTAAFLSHQAEKQPIKERTLGLTLFCQNVVINPFLRNDPDWKALSRSESETYTPDKTNIGETQLLECLSQLTLSPEYPLPDKFDVIRGELRIMEQHAKALLEKVRKLESAEKTLQAATEGIHQGLETWIAAEKNHLKIFTGKIFDDQDPVIKPHETVLSSIDALNTVFTVRSNVEEVVSSYTGLTLAVLFEYELAIIDALRELLKWHDDTLKEIESYKNKCKSSYNEKNEKKLQEWKEIIQQKETSITHFYKGLVYFTLPLVARQRAHNVRRFFSGRITALQSTSFSLYKACEAFFNQTILNSELVAEDTARMIEILKIKPISNPPYEESGGLNALKSAKRASTDSIRNIYLSYHTTGLIDLFDRALAASQRRPYRSTAAKPSSTGPPAPPPKPGKFPPPPPPVPTSYEEEGEFIH